MTLSVILGGLGHGVIKAFVEIGPPREKRETSLRGRVAFRGTDSKITSAESIKQDREEHIVS